MFNTIIGKTSLTTKGADACFGNIRSEVYNGDVTMESTLRALLWARIPKDESLTVMFKIRTYAERTINEYSPNRVINALCDNHPAMERHVIIHNIQTTERDASANFALVKNHFCNTFKNWSELKKIEEFYKKSFRTVCFINPVQKSVYLFVENLDVKKLHYLECSILAFLPWYFDAEKGVTKDEMDLIKSLREKTPNKYLDCIEKIAAGMDIKRKSVEVLLDGFESRSEKKECEDIRRQINDCIEKILELKRGIKNTLEHKADCEIRLMGLENKTKNEGSDSEIMNYFLSNKNITLEDVTNNTIVFSCRDYATYYDEDMLETLLENKSSYLYYNRGGSSITAEEMEMLLRTIFIDQKLKMKFCAAYEFDIKGSVRGLSDFKFGYECKDCTPNVHIDNYRCLGNYEIVINEYLLKNDYIGAIEQCVASCKSLNWADSTVINELMRRLYGVSGSGKNVRCIELPDGSVVEPKEAIKWLKEENENE